MPKRFFLYIGLVLAAALLPFSAEADFRTNLYYGLKNDTQVRELQRFLADQGIYKGPVTGNYLGLTREAVRSFQAREGISPLGVFGPQTRARANALLSARTAAMRADLEAQLEGLREQVRILQARLGQVQAREVAPTVIEPRSLVALNCFYYYAPTGRLLNLGKGSGVIIKPDGTILTARHVVDLKYSYLVDPESVTADIAMNSSFDHCEVGQIPAGAELPDAETIRSRNPSINVPLLPYEALLTYLPSSANLGVSELEASHLDFALLKITRVNGDAGVTELPASFPAAQIFSGRLKAGDEVLTYGYPADTTIPSSLRTFRLVGGAGTVKSVQIGDQRYREVPLVINTEMAAQHGRSGSPLFYKGYVAGIVTAHAAGNVTDSYSVSLEAILPILREVLGQI